MSHRFISRRSPLLFLISALGGAAVIILEHMKERDERAKAARTALV